MSQVINTREGSKPVLLMVSPLLVMTFLLFVSAQPLTVSRNRPSTTSSVTRQRVAL